MATDRLNVSVSVNGKTRVQIGSAQSQAGPDSRAQARGANAVAVADGGTRNIAVPIGNSSVAQAVSGPG